MTFTDLQTRRAGLSASAELVNTRYQYFFKLSCLTSFYYCTLYVNDTQANAMTHTREYRLLLESGTIYIYYFRSFYNAEPVPLPLTQNPGDATAKKS